VGRKNPPKQAASSDQTRESRKKSELFPTYNKGAPSWSEESAKASRFFRPDKGKPEKVGTVSDLSKKRGE
ncbi:MAG: hypothetical protein II911_01335, partial [Clostridia bacterium]|nr:hypothetical protein [Clostridia bacterium]